jgi:hypothetical protein
MGFPGGQEGGPGHSILRHQIKLSVTFCFDATVWPASCYHRCNGVSMTQSEKETRRFLMYRKAALQLKGKIVDRIERKGDAVYVYFTDGSALEIGGSRGYRNDPMVYVHKPE